MNPSVATSSLAMRSTRLVSSFPMRSTKPNSTLPTRSPRAAISFRVLSPWAALPRWNAVQRELVSRLVDFGADPKARDASRVLRLVSTCNTNQPDPELRKVRVLWVEEADGEPLLHDFERLAEAVLLTIAKK